jgi:hypothetical protein
MVRAVCWRFWNVTCASDTLEPWLGLLILSQYVQMELVDASTPLHCTLSLSGLPLESLNSVETARAAKGMWLLDTATPIRETPNIMVLGCLRPTRIWNTIRDE